MGTFYEMVLKGRKMIKENPRKCDVCQCVETLENIILKYDNGKYMCDDCAYDFYGKGEFI